MIFQSLVAWIPLQQNKLNEAGIWQYDQLHSMTARQAANLKQKLNLRHIDWDSLSELSGKPATVESSATADANAAGASKLRFDSATIATANSGETNVQGADCSATEFL